MELFIFGILVVILLIVVFYFNYLSYKSGYKKGCEDIKNNYEKTIKEKNYK